MLDWNWTEITKDKPRTWGFGSVANALERLYAPESGIDEVRIEGCYARIVINEKFNRAHAKTLDNYFRKLFDVSSEKWDVCMSTRNAGVVIKVVRDNKMLTDEMLRFLDLTRFFHR